MDFLELPLREWRKIAYNSNNQELIDFVRRMERLATMDNDELFILQHVDRGGYDTGEYPAPTEEELRVAKMLQHWADEMARVRDLPVMGM